MTNEEQVSVFRQGSEAWRKWLGEHFAERVDLTDADLANLDLQEIYLRNAGLRNATSEERALPTQSSADRPSGTQISLGPTSPMPQEAIKPSGRLRMLLL